MYNSTKVNGRELGGSRNVFRREFKEIRADDDRKSIRSMRGHRGDSLQDERDSGG